jgi:hypothetical protein
MVKVKLSLLRNWTLLHADVWIGGRTAPCILNLSFIYTLEGRMESHPRSPQNPHFHRYGNLSAHNI